MRTELRPASPRKRASSSAKNTERRRSKKRSYFSSPIASRTRRRIRDSLAEYPVMKFSMLSQPPTQTPRRRTSSPKPSTLEAPWVRRGRGGVGAVIGRRSVRFARDVRTGGTDQEVEVRAAVRLLHVLNVELLPPALRRGEGARRRVRHLPAAQLVVRD